MIVIKFGGAAMADSDNVRNSVEYIKKIRDKKPVVVVSAMKGVTDILIKTIDDAVNKRNKNVLDNTNMLRVKHEKPVNELINSEKLKNEALKYFNESFLELYSIFKSISVLGECSPKTYDYVVSMGEKLSSKIVASVLLDEGILAEQVIGEDLIVTDSNFTNAFPNMESTEKKVKSRLSSPDTIPIITGFTGANEKRETTTLGRGGSDFTASILAYCLNAEEAWFLKEVDGILTADPKLVANAKTVARMSYDEVAELSYFGAKVLHPVAILPLKEKQIPSFIKNVYSFDFIGTEITNKKITNGHPIKAITAIKDASLITVQSQGMVGIPGIVARTFSAIAKSNINVQMISQSSSEQNICFIIKITDQMKAIAALNKEFELEIIKKQIGHISSEDGVSIVCAVGEGMKNIPGIAGKIFSVLGDNKINIKLIAQGSSELNVSFVIDSKCVDSAINCIHEEFNLGG